MFGETQAERERRFGLNDPCPNFELWAGAAVLAAICLCLYRLT